MRYSKNEATYILANFESGDTVTIDIYKLSDNSQVVSSGSCSEIGSTGVFKYLFSQTVSQKEEYLWIASNGSYNQMGKIVLGGWMDNVEGKINDNLDVAVSTRSSHTPSDVDSELSSTHGSGSWEGAGASDIADAVWDEKLNEHQKANTTGYELKHITGGIVPRQSLTVRDKEKILEYLETLLKKLNAVVTKLSDEQIKKLANDLAQRLVSDIEKQNELRDRILLSLADINTLEELFNYEHRADSSGISKKETRTSGNHNSKA